MLRVFFFKVYLRLLGKTGKKQERNMRRPWVLELSSIYLQVPRHSLVSLETVPTLPYRYILQESDAQECSHWPNNRWVHNFRKELLTLFMKLWFLFSLYCMTHWCRSAVPSTDCSWTCFCQVFGALVVQVLVKGPCITFFLICSST